MEGSYFPGCEICPYFFRHLDYYGKIAKSRCKTEVERAKTHSSPRISSDFDALKPAAVNGMLLDLNHG